MTLDPSKKNRLPVTEPIDLTSNQASDIMQNWMTELRTNPHFTHDVSIDKSKFEQESKQFLHDIVHTLQAQPMPDLTDCHIEPVVAIWHQILKTHRQKGLTTKDTAMLIFSLKSGLSAYLKEHSDDLNISNQADVSQLNRFLDVLGLLTFEIYSAEHEAVITKQSNQIEYLTHETLSTKDRPVIGQSDQMKAVFRAIGLILETDVTVLLEGESGTGKDVLANVIHAHSPRKNQPFVTLNCGAIPKELIESELFGHEKGAFTGATQTRSGYFEEADGGTIFLDEVGELPLPTQVRLLRVLETGEFIKVGSSKVQKSNTRIVAATNVNMMDAIDRGKFREDLYYRLSTVEIKLPPLRDRKEDIALLFRKFASDFAQKYHMPQLQLDEHAQALLTEYRWSGNIRQLRNIAEQISVLEKERNINAALLRSYLPDPGAQLPAVLNKKERDSDFSSEREILYKVLFDMKSDLNDLKKLTLELINSENLEEANKKNQGLIEKIYGKESVKEEADPSFEALPVHETVTYKPTESIDKYAYAETIEEEEPLSLQEKELEMIKQALKRSNGKRKLASKELGISERTLYRKIKQYDLNDIDED